MRVLWLLLAGAMGRDGLHLNTKYQRQRSSPARRQLTAAVQGAEMQCRAQGSPSAASVGAAEIWARIASCPLLSLLQERAKNRSA